MILYSCRRVTMTLMVLWSGFLVAEGNFQLNDFVESSIRKQPGKVRDVCSDGWMDGWRCMF